MKTDCSAVWRLVRDGNGAVCEVAYDAGDDAWVMRLPDDVSIVEDDAINAWAQELQPGMAAPPAPAGWSLAGSD